MYITLEADYAVRIVETIALSQARINAKSISEKTGVPLRFCLKILNKLVNKDIIKSYKGVKGGYELLKKAKNITLREVIEAVEGPFLMSRCVEHKYLCKNRDCRFYSVYDDISKLVRDKLDAVTFSEY